MTTAETDATEHSHAVVIKVIDLCPSFHTARMHGERQIKCFLLHARQRLLMLLLLCSLTIFSLAVLLYLKCFFNSNFCSHNPLCWWRKLSVAAATTWNVNWYLSFFYLFSNHFYFHFANTWQFCLIKIKTTTTTTMTRITTNDNILSSL